MDGLSGAWDLPPRGSSRLGSFPEAWTRDWAQSPVGLGVGAGEPAVGTVGPGSVCTFGLGKLKRERFLPPETTRQIAVVDGRRSHR